MYTNQLSGLGSHPRCFLSLLPRSSLSCVLKARQGHPCPPEPGESQERAAFSSQCFHRDLKIVLFVFQYPRDFFFHSKQLLGGQTKLKDKHYGVKPKPLLP